VFGVRDIILPLYEISFVLVSSIYIASLGARLARLYISHDSTNAVNNNHFTIFTEIPFNHLIPSDLLANLICTWRQGNRDRQRQILGCGLHQGCASLVLGRPRSLPGGRGTAARRRSTTAGPFKESRRAKCKRYPFVLVAAFHALSRPLFPTSNHPRHRRDADSKRLDPCARR